MTVSDERLQRWQSALNTLPLVAILRGVTPDEVIEVGKVLCECGFRIIEVPLNSPDPFDSIAALRGAMPEEVIVGAGTVLSAGEVDQCGTAGCELIVAPNFNSEVASQCASQAMLYCPGIATPSEAFSALDAGAHALKFFPAEIIGPAGVKAMLAVLPKGTVALPVGGIESTNMQEYLTAGAGGFGIGSSLYLPGLASFELELRARQLAAKFEKIA